jgi:hypothetical protein
MMMLPGLAELQAAARLAAATTMAAVKPFSNQMNSQSV